MPENIKFPITPLDFEVAMVGCKPAVEHLHDLDPMVFHKESGRRFFSPVVRVVFYLNLRLFGLLSMRTLSPEARTRWRRSSFPDRHKIERVLTIAQAENRPHPIVLKGASLNSLTDLRCNKARSTEVGLSYRGASRAIL